MLATNGVRALTVKTDDQTRVAVDVSFGAVPTNDSSPAIIVNLRRSTEQLVRYAARLQRQNQELDQFASVAAHDLRAPLRAISNLSSWIEEDLEDSLDEDTRKHLGLLRNRVGRMELLIDGIHRFASIDRKRREFETVNCGEMIHETFEEQCGDKQMTLVVLGEPPELNEDRTRLWQVFTNLIGNAIHHHDRSSGTISVRCHIEALLCVSVSDDGPGIPDEHHERVFGMFKTLKPKGPDRIDRPWLSTGEKNRQRPRRRNLDRTKVWARHYDQSQLAFTGQHRIMTVGDTSDHEYPIHGRMTILLVEDDAVDAAHIMRCARKLPVSIMHVTNADDALAILRAIVRTAS